MDREPGQARVKSRREKKTKKGNKFPDENGKRCDAVPWFFVLSCDGKGGLIDDKFFRAKKKEQVNAPLSCPLPPGALLRDQDAERKASNNKNQKHPSQGLVKMGEGEG